MEKIKVVTGLLIQQYELPIGPDIEGKVWRVNTLPHLKLYILDESEIDLLIDKLLEIRKQYCDAKNAQTEKPKE